MNAVASPLEKVQQGCPQAQTAGFWIVRPARLADLPAVAALAAMTGGGFIALPDDRRALERRLAHSAASLAADIGAPLDELYMLVLEDAESGRIGGTACLNSRVGTRSPVYSFRLRTIETRSAALGYGAELAMLEVSRELEGLSEVGGLFLHPTLRTGGLGRLLAKSRYLFIAQHRARFGGKVLAELRGWLAPDGSSPFWDAVGRRFYPVDFAAADRMRHEHGCQALVDLLPDAPIPVPLLSPQARGVIGKTHETGVPALRLLEAEGFRHFGSIDLLEGGPNLIADTDEITTLRSSRPVPLRLGASGDRTVVSVGTGVDFRAWLGTSNGADGVNTTPAGARLLQLEEGQVVRHAPA